MSWSILLLISSASLHATLASTFGGVPSALLVYPAAARSERDLHLCSEREVCSVVHKRFWGAPPMIERLCRCPGRLECPSNWVEDTRSMHLNTRAQLKFCKEITKMKRCRAGTVSVTLTTRRTPPDELTQAAAAVSKSAVASCVCPGPPAPRKWQHRNHHKKDYGNGTTEVINTYACSKLHRCEIDDFCGHVRADLFSAYYRCSCPKGSLCVSRGREPPRNVTELLFSGLAYQAHCTPYPRINMIN